MMNIIKVSSEYLWLSLQGVGVSSSVQFMGGAECPVSTGLSLTRRDTDPSEALAGTSGSPVSPGST